MDHESILSLEKLPERILVTRLRYLGDVILTTPAIAALARRYPSASIHYLVEKPYAAVLERNPHVAGIIELERGVRGAINAVRRLRKMQFDVAIDWFYNPRSALILYLAAIPVRIGGSRGIRSRLYNHLVTVPEGVQSAIEHHLAFLRDLGAKSVELLPRVYLGEEEISKGREELSRMFKGVSKRVVAIHPGGTWPAKRWDVESFAALARMVRNELEASVAVITGPGEEQISRKVCAQACGAAFALPSMPVRKIAALISACEATVANDGGIMHLAVSLRKPTVGILGPTDPVIWFPYEGLGPFSVIARRAPCAPCNKHYCEDLSCLAAVKAEEVFRRLKGVLEWKG